MINEYAKKATKKFTSKVQKPIDDKVTEVIAKRLADFDVVTMKDILQHDQLHKDIVGIIQSYVIQSNEFMNNKKKIWGEYEAKLLNPEVHKEDIIKFHLLYQHLKAHVSNYYNSELTVLFPWFEYWYDDLWYKLEKMAERDQELMKKDRKDFVHVFNYWFYWMSVRIKTWYDKYNKVITYDTINPKNCFIQKMSILNQFDFFAYTTTISRSKIDAINTIARNNNESDIYMNTNSMWSYNFFNENSTSKLDRSLNQEAAKSAEVDNLEVYIRLQTNWYKFTVTAWMKISRCMHVKPLTDEEIKNPLLVSPPIAFTFLFPLEVDPGWLGLAELLLSFQDAKNKLMNLSLIKEERNAWFKQIIADVSQIANIQQLADRNPNWPTIIPADSSGQWLQNPFIEVWNDRVDWNTLQLADKLDFEAQTESWYSAVNRWMPWPKQTLWEAQQQQVNSNLLFRLDSLVVARWEEDFRWNIWLRWLLENLPEAEKKYIRIWNSLIESELEINKNDIKKWLMSKIKVVSKKIQLEDNEKQLTILLAREPMMMANPKIPEISKTLLQREICYLSGNPREKVLSRYPIKWEERRALRYKWMISAWEMPKNLFQAWMDVFTYYITFQACRDWKVKSVVLEKLEELLMEETQQQQEQPQAPGNPVNNAVASSNASQMISNLIAWQTGGKANLATRES